MSFDDDMTYFWAEHRGKPIAIARLEAYQRALPSLAPYKAVSDHFYKAFTDRLEVALEG